MIDRAEKALYGASCQDSLGMKAIHVFQRCLYRCEAVSDHASFVGGKGLDQVRSPTGHADKGPTKRCGVSQSGVRPDSPQWRHIVKRIAKQRHPPRSPRLDRHGCLYRECSDRDRSAFCTNHRRTGCHSSISAITAAVASLPLSTAGFDVKPSVSL